MFCKKCGAQLKDGAKFCTKCGTKLDMQASVTPQQQVVPQPKVTPQQQVVPQPKVTPQQQIVPQPKVTPQQQVVPQSEVTPQPQSTASYQTKEPKEKSHKGLVIALVCLIVVLILAVGILLYIYFGLQKDDSDVTISNAVSSEESSEEQSEEESEAAESSKEAQAVAAPEGTIPKAEVADAADAVSDNTSEEPNGELGTYPSTHTDYSNEQLLNIDDYDYYDSGYPNFSFGYPSEIFNDEYISTETTDGCYGRIVEDVHLSGDDGIFVEFTLTRRTDGDSIPGMTDEVYEHERSFIVNPADILHSVKRDKGTVITTGYTSSDEACIFYNLAMVDVDYVYQMKIYYPSPTDNDDKRHKDYFIECMYRLCGFSGYSD